MEKQLKMKTIYIVMVFTCLTTCLQAQITPASSRQSTIPVITATTRPQKIPPTSIVESTKGNSVWVPERVVLINGQKVRVPGYWSRINVEKIKKPPVFTATAPYMTTVDNFKWVFSQVTTLPNGQKTTVPGHWERQTANDGKNRLNAKTIFNYPAAHSFSKYPNPKPFGLPKENFTGLSEKVSSNVGLNGDPGRLNVYYFQKLDLRMIPISVPDRDYVIVADTFYVPPMGPLSCTFFSLQCCQKTFLKVIANCIVYESPINLHFTGKTPSGILDVVYSAEKVFFRHPDRLSTLQLNPMPPLFYISNAATQKANIYQDNWAGETEVRLINRMTINRMEMAFSKLNSVFDAWERDKLIEEFQTCRGKIRHQSGGLQLDPTYNNRFNAVCKSFDERKFSVERLRTVGNLSVIVDADKLPLQPIRYHALPNKAVLMPVRGQNDTTALLGTILYKPVGDTKLKLFVETTLDYQQNHIDALKQELQAKGVVLTENLPQNLISIKEQPLKIGGKTMGRIVPVSNRLLRLEFDLPEEGKSIITIFPKIGNVSFKVDFDIFGTLKSQDVVLEVDKSLLDKLNYSKVLESFAVTEYNDLTTEVRVSSNFDALLPDEGALLYAEVLLEIQFRDGTTLLRGPYRLSSYGTLASDVIIPFLKKSPEYNIIVSGRALYENGERQFQHFNTQTSIIIVDESVFVK
jgi:hypothetical protein